MKMDLKGKRAVVCGSTQGIGRAVAIEFANAGASILLIARNETTLLQVKNELNTTDEQNHDFIAIDFSDANQLKEQVNRLASINPPYHILVNNTGGPPGGLAFEAQTEEFISAFSNHLICNQILTQAFVPGMKSEKYGRIINVISTSVKQPIKGLGVSNTIRGAVASWSKTLAEELGPFGITVNNVLPGATRTNRLASLIQTSAQKSGSTTEEVAKKMKSAIPVGRFAEPEELAYAVAFLASPLAGYINGINLPVDGGRTLCL